MTLLRRNRLRRASFMGSTLRSEAVLIYDTRLRGHKFTIDDLGFGGENGEVIVKMVGEKRLNTLSYV